MLSYLFAAQYSIVLTFHHKITEKNHDTTVFPYILNKYFDFSRHDIWWKWTAWFSPEIPVQNGPWKLGGLPGLILEAYAEGNQYSLIATGIQQSAKPIRAVYLANEYEATDLIKYLKAKRSFMENPLGKINAQLSGSAIRIASSDGTEIKQCLFLQPSPISWKPIIIKKSPDLLSRDISVTTSPTSPLPSPCPSICRCRALCH